MSKQGKASVSGQYDHKVEPKPTLVNPGAVSYLGNKLGNHTTDKDGFPLNIDPWDAGRGYMAPLIGKKRHNSGSQGSY